MKKILLPLITKMFAPIAFTIIFFVACDKNAPDDGVNTAPYYNLDVTLLPVTTKMEFGAHAAGFLKFRQDKDTARIITLDTWVFDLQPNHSYSLRRAVDPIATSSCVSTSWLTLGKGLVPQTIDTDAKGNGEADLFRDITAIARGAQFRIHFQIVDAATGEIVLNSDCYQYTVR